MAMMLLIIALVSVCAARSPENPDDLPPRTPAQNYVITGLLRQPAGLTTLESLHLPEAYLRRLADRVIQSSFEQQLRLVVRDSGPALAVPPPPAASSHDSTTTAAAMPDPNRRILAWLPLGIGIVFILAVGIVLAMRKGGSVS